MTRAEPERSRHRHASTVRAALIGLSLAGASTAHAVVCHDGAPPLDDAALPATKFAMAARDCTWTAPPSTTRREAEQLALYRDTPVGSTHTTAPAVPAAPAPVALPHRAPMARPAAAAAPRRPIAGEHARRIRTVAPALARAARDYGIDPWLLHAVAHVESRHNPVAQSHAGARGLMQVMPATARRFGVQQPHHELLDFETNVRVSAEYLKVLQGRFGNNLPLVLAAYNAGEGAVEKYGRKIPPYKETQAYVRSVIDTYLQLRSAAQRALPQASRSVTP